MLIENTQTYGWESAIRGMRNPKNSWDLSDSNFDNDIEIGERDFDLMMRLSKAGTDHRKYLRMIGVSCDIVAPNYWVAELDTYKVGTVRNSCSLQHKGASRDFTTEDFTWEGNTEELEEILKIVNNYRQLYVETKDYRYFRMMRQILPMGYNYRFTWSANYEVLNHIYNSRKCHMLKEWHIFCDWIRKLPYSELITYNNQK